jgi:hypothetical protein
VRSRDGTRWTIETAAVMPIGTARTSAMAAVSSVPTISGSPPYELFCGSHLVPVISPSPEKRHAGTEFQISVTRRPRR